MLQRRAFFILTVWAIFTFQMPGQVNIAVAATAQSGKGIGSFQHHTYRPSAQSAGRFFPPVLYLSAATSKIDGQSRLVRELTTAGFHVHAVILFGPDAGKELPSGAEDWFEEQIFLHRHPAFMLVHYDLLPLLQQLRKQWSGASVQALAIVDAASCEDKFFWDPRTPQFWLPDEGLKNFSDCGIPYAPAGAYRGRAHDRREIILSRWLLQHVRHCESGGVAAHIIDSFAKAKPLSPCFSVHLDSIATGYDLQQQINNWYLSGGRRLAGYKLALANPAAQRRFGINAPVSGSLFADMLVGSGQTADLHRASGLMYEADLLFKVADRSFNHAQTLSELAAAIESLVAFIELPERGWAAGVRPNGAQFVALNAAARLGVRGDSLTVVRGDDLLTALSNLSVEVRQDGRLLTDRSFTEAGPMLANLFKLRSLLHQQGIRVEPGQLLSLGALTPPRLLEGSGTLSVRYRLGEKKILTASVRIIESGDSGGGR